MKKKMPITPDKWRRNVSLLLRIADKGGRGSGKYRQLLIRHSAVQFPKLIDVSCRQILRPWLILEARVICDAVQKLLNTYPL